MFDAYELTPKGKEAVTTTKTAFHDLLTTLEKTGVDTKTREYSIVKTKLEEACFWAVRNVSKNGFAPTTGEEMGPVS